MEYNEYREFIRKFVSVQQAEQIREASRLAPLKIDASPSGFTLPGSRSAVKCFALLNSYTFFIAVAYKHYFDGYVLPTRFYNRRTEYVPGFQ